MQTTQVKEHPQSHAYRFSWFDWLCLWYPPGWLILFNRHWQYYKPDPDGWRWSEYPLLLVPGGFYLALVIRRLRLMIRDLLSHTNQRHQSGHPGGSEAQIDLKYQQAFREEVLTPIVKHYFRSELHNLDHLPVAGPLIITINHAGMCFPWDFLNLALLLSEQREWLVQPLAHPLFFDHLWLKWWLPKGWAQGLGGVRAEAESFEAAIAQRTVMLYAPEGWRGLVKGWPERYQLSRFDASFVSLSIRYKVPILPILCVGNERLHPFAFNVQAIARMVKMPMFPLSPLIPIFALFPSMGIWAVRSRLQYYVQPLWKPWEEGSLDSDPTPRKTVTYRLAQSLRSRLQGALNCLTQRTN